MNHSYTVVWSCALTRFHVIGLVFTTLNKLVCVDRNLLNHKADGGLSPSACRKNPIAASTISFVASPQFTLIFSIYWRRACIWASERIRFWLPVWPTG